MKEGCCPLFSGRTPFFLTRLFQVSRATERTALAPLACAANACPSPVLCQACGDDLRKPKAVAKEMVALVSAQTLVVNHHERVRVRVKPNRLEIDMHAVIDVRDLLCFELAACDLISGNTRLRVWAVQWHDGTPTPRYVEVSTSDDERAQRLWKRLHAVVTLSQNLPLDERRASFARYAKRERVAGRPVSQFFDAHTITRWTHAVEAGLEDLCVACFEPMRCDSGAGKQVWEMPMHKRCYDRWKIIRAQASAS